MKDRMCIFKVCISCFFVCLFFVDVLIDSKRTYVQKLVALYTRM